MEGGGWRVEGGGQTLNPPSNASKLSDQILHPTLYTQNLHTPWSRETANAVLRETSEHQIRGRRGGKRLFMREVGGLVRALAAVHHAPATRELFTLPTESHKGLEFTGDNAGCVAHNVVPH